MHVSKSFYSIARKNCVINLTVIRIRLKDGKWEYCLSAPCTHCNKSLCNFNRRLKCKFGKGTRINIRWTISSTDFILTPYKSIFDVTESKISSGWAKKYNRWQEYNKKALSST